MLSFPRFKTFRGIQKVGRRRIDNLRSFVYQNLLVSYHKIFIIFLFVVKALMPIFFNS